MLIAVRFEILFKVELDLIWVNLKAPINQEYIHKDIKNAHACTKKLLESISAISITIQKHNKMHPQILSMFFFEIGKRLSKNIDSVELIMDNITKPENKNK